MKHLNYVTKLSLSSWRKMSIGSWKPKGDSSIYVFEDFVVDDVLNFCNKQQISFNSFIIKSLSSTINEHSRINSIIRFGNIYEREKNSIFVHVLPNEVTDDLTGVIIEDAYKKTIENVDLNFKTQVDKVRLGEDKFNKSKNSFKYLPVFFSKLVMDALSFIMYSLNFYSAFLPSPKDPFGSIMLTSLETLNVERALCPIAPYTRIPMVVSVGKTTLRPIVADGEIKKGNVTTVGFTFDHRIMDGIHFSEFLNTMKRFFNEPELLK